MSCAKVLASLVGTCLLLTLPAIGQIDLASSKTKDSITILADSHIRPATDKVDDAKTKLEQLVRDRHAFNPFRHKGDLAIVISGLGVLIGGIKLYVELRKRRKPAQPPAFTPQAGPR